MKSIYIYDFFSTNTNCPISVFEIELSIFIIPTPSKTTILTNGESTKISVDFNGKFEVCDFKNEKLFLMSSDLRDFVLK